MKVTTVGLDITKNVFQVHGVDAGEQVVIRRQLRRSQVIAFSGSNRPVLSAWKLVQHRIIGHASFKSLDMTFDLCRQPMSNLTLSGTRTMPQLQRKHPGKHAV